MKIGVLALQGDFQAHIRMITALDVLASEVRTPSDLEHIDGLIIPGGESTTMTIGVEREGLAKPLADFATSSAPILGTCAGMIMLDRDHLGLMDIATKRNAFGRQIRSFETQLQLTGIVAEPLQAVFIRAPWVVDHGPEVTVLAEIDQRPVAVRQQNRLAVSFHPEISGELGLHRWLVEAAQAHCS